MVTIKNKVDVIVVNGDENQVALVACRHNDQKEC